MRNLLALTLGAVTMCSGVPTDIPDPPEGVDASHRLEVTRDVDAGGEEPSPCAKRGALGVPLPCRRYDVTRDLGYPLP